MDLEHTPGSMAVVMKGIIATIRSMEQVHIHIQMAASITASGKKASNMEMAVSSMLKRHLNAEVCGATAR